MIKRKVLVVHGHTEEAYKMAGYLEKKGHDEISQAGAIPVAVSRRMNDVAAHVV